MTISVTAKKKGSETKLSISVNKVEDLDELRGIEVCDVSVTCVDLQSLADLDKLSTYITYLRGLVSWGAPCSAS